MAVGDADFLRDRAERFRNLARDLGEEGSYDFAAFHFQQAAELRLKHALFVALGDYPRTHALKRLLDSYGQAAGRDQATEEFLDDHIDVISNLENAYITARYLPGDFRKKEIENMSAWVDRLWDFLDEGAA